MIPSLCRDNMDVIMMVGYEIDTQFHWVVFSWRKNGTSCLLFYSAAQEFKSECVKSEYLSDMQELTASRKSKEWGGWKKKTAWLIGNVWYSYGGETRRK